MLDSQKTEMQVEGSKSEGPQVFDPMHDRTVRAFGSEAFERIATAKVCLLGLGGVGSFCLSSLVRAGISDLLILDGDEFDVTNLNRQELAFRSTIGKRKVNVATEFVHEINPACRVQSIDSFILSDTAGEIAAAIDAYSPDWVVDCIDSISVKLLLAEHFVRDRSLANYISAMGAATKLDPSRIHLAMLSETKNDPLCRIMRKECRKRGIPDFKVCYSDELAEVDPEAKITRGVGKKILGSVSFIPSIMGITIASSVLRSIAQK